MKAASTALTRLGIRHVVVGDLAVGANGYPRATKDVQSLVGGEAFEHHPGALVTMKGGVPIQINGVPIDLLSVQVTNNTWPLRSKRRWDRASERAPVMRDREGHDRGDGNDGGRSADGSSDA